MRAITFTFIALSILAGSLLTSCIDDDFTTNPSHVLAFSTDTVAFDTVFTTIGSSTRSFRVYNPNKKSLNISSIKLADAERSGFHINVDGMSGDQFTDVEIRGKDSIFVFVKGDTVRIEKYKYLYRDRVVVDTVRLVERDSVQVPVPVEKPLTRWQQWKIELGGFAMAAILALLAFGIFRLVRKLRK